MARTAVRLGYLFTCLSLLLLVGNLFSFSRGMPGTTRAQAAEHKIREICVKLEVYRMLGGRYPTNAQGLRALVVEPRVGPLPNQWKAQYRKLPRDPWGQDYRYRLHPDGTYEILSFGEDGRGGTKDDISSHDIGSRSIP